MDGIPIPTLRSPRLVLRRFFANDHRHLLDMANDSEVTRYLNEGPPPSAGGSLAAHGGRTRAMGLAWIRYDAGRRPRGIC
jgi:RimJ/RimL family protein N-acetyltransferase